MVTCTPVFCYWRFFLFRYGSADVSVRRSNDSSISCFASCSVNRTPGSNSASLSLLSGCPICRLRFVDEHSTDMNDEIRNAVALGIEPPIDLIIVQLIDRLQHSSANFRRFFHQVGFDCLLQCAHGKREFSC
jgi:hypothetical protein